MATVNQILKRLKKDGWYLHRHGANHDQYRHPTKKGQIAVHRHGSSEVAKGTENSIMKAAGLKNSAAFKAEIKKTPKET